MSYKHINTWIVFFLAMLLMTACQSRVARDQPNGDIEDRSKEASTEMKNEESRFEQGSLLEAVKDKNKEMVRSILETPDYPVDEVNSKSETALLIAVHNNSIEISKMLIDHNADINKQDKMMDSPYLYAGAQGKTEILRYMLENATPDENVYNRFGGNALIPAAEKGHLENVILLLEKSKTNIDHQNNFGYTALIEAVALTDGSQTYQDIIQVLLENGANPHLKDNYGKTALEYARELNYGEMERILRDYN